MFQKNQTHFENLAAFARFFSVSNHFGTLCIKGLTSIVDSFRFIPYTFSNIVKNKTYLF